jgi:hypothetical protein
MSKVDEYQKILSETSDWPAYLMSESNLPGPRGNLELAQAVAGSGTEQQFLSFLQFTPQLAPENTTQSFLAFCGTLGLGTLIANGQEHYLATLKQQANDPRWRTREAVAMAMQHIGDHNSELLLEICHDWKSGTWLEQRAVVAGICEPRVLNSKTFTEIAMIILDEITTHIQQAIPNKADDFRTLRQALGYGWSVIIVASPDPGKGYLENWSQDPHPDIRWIVKENLKKKRLQRMDADWVNKFVIN